MSLKLLGNTQKGRVFIVSAPAGTGKTTLAQKLVKEFPCVVANVSYTTRLPRRGEIQGVHYQFVSQVAFEKKIAAGDFLEHVTLYGDYYGTSREWIEGKLDEGKHVLLVIDTQGALFLRDKICATLIFISPPSVAELKRRLCNRATESLEKIEARLEIVEHELKAKKFYDYEIVNDNLDIAYQVFRSIFIAEEHRVSTD